MDYVTQVVWQDKGTMRDLMTRKITFPRSEPMRKVYGAASVVDKLGTPLAVPENAGLALRAGLLSTDAKETSPILRGAFIRRRILCDERLLDRLRARGVVQVLPHPPRSIDMEVAALA